MHAFSDHRPKHLLTGSPWIRRFPSVFSEVFQSVCSHVRSALVAVHRDIQLFLSTHNRRLIELPRDHGKTTQLCGRLLWEMGHCPELRIRLFCAAESIAKDRVQFLRDSIGNHETLRRVFPALRTVGRSRSRELSVVRPRATIGSSVSALGIGSAVTGVRADLLVCDDIVDAKALGSTVVRDRVKRMFRENMSNLLEPDGRFWGLCTPWHQFDLNAELKENGVFGLLRQPVGAELQPVWPQRWSTAALTDRRQAIGETAFDRGYRLTAVSDESTIIRRTWIQFWTEPVESEVTVLAVDPAISTSETADQTACVLLGKAPDGTIRVLSAQGCRIPAPSIGELLMRKAAEFRIDAIVFEENGAFASVLQMLQNLGLPLPPIRGIRQHTDKRSRAAAFSVAVESGRVRLRGVRDESAEETAVHPMQRELFEEMVCFPIGRHDDLLDATMMGYRFLTQNPDPRVL